jgi:hypothetical protein
MPSQRDKSQPAANFHAGLGSTNVEKSIANNFSASSKNSTKRLLNSLSPIGAGPGNKQSKHDIDEILSKIEDIIDFANGLAKKVDFLEDKIGILEKRASSGTSWAQLAAKDDKLGDTNAKPIKAMISSLIDENERRKHALIFFGISELNSDDYNAKKVHDNSKVCEILDFLKIDKSCMAGVHRFKGKHNSRGTPPIRLVLVKEFDRTRILKNAPRLKNSHLYYVYIKPDMNEAELMAERQLITDRNSKNGEL